MKNRALQHSSGGWRESARYVCLCYCNCENILQISLCLVGLVVHAITLMILSRAAFIRSLFNKLLIILTVFNTLHTLILLWDSLGMHCRIHFYKKYIIQVGLTPESNSILKCILGPKRFSVQKLLGPKKC